MRSHVEVDWDNVGECHVFIISQLAFQVNKVGVCTNLRMLWLNVNDEDCSFFPRGYPVASSQKEKQYFVIIISSQLQPFALGLLCWMGVNKQEIMNAKPCATFEKVPPS